MSGLALALALSVLLLQAPAPRRQAPPLDDPRLVVQQATSAVRGDSVAPVRARWDVRLARDSSDRAATLAVATIAALTYDYPLSERLYRRLFSTATSDGYAVYARIGLALQFDEYGAMPEVDGLLSGAVIGARFIGDRAAEGEALSWLGYVRARSQGYDVGMALFDSALQVLPPNAVTAQAITRCRRAHLQVLTGKPHAAAELKAASAYARRAEEPRAGGPCMKARAIELSHRGEVDSAVGVYAAYADALGRAHDVSGRAVNLAWQAELLRSELADFGGAREALYEAQADAEASHNGYGKAITTLFMGQLFLSLNDPGTAGSYMDEAVTAAEALADSEVLMVSRSWRGLVSLAAGDLARARRETLETLDYFTREGDLENQSEIQRALAEIAIRQRDWAGAEEALDKSEVFLRKLKTSPVRIEQPFERGRLALYRGDSVSAQRFFARYLTGLDSSAHLKRFEARTYLADSYTRLGKLDVAEQQMGKASDELERWRATLSAQDLRVSAFQAGASAQNDRNASVARVLASLAQGGRVDAAFALAERRRARELMDRLIQNAALETSHARESGAGITRDVAQVSAADVAAILPDDRTALIEYVTGARGAPTTVFVVTRGRRGGQVAQARILLPADSLTGGIGRFAALVLRGADTPRDAQALGGALLDPIVGMLNPAVTRLVIVPDGSLHRVPWDALRMRDGRLLVERYAIGIAPSAGVLVRLRHRERAPSAAPARLLAFGDPIFPGERGGSTQATRDAASEGFQSAFASTGGLPRLEGSGREVRAIARYAPGAEVKVRDAASESYLVRSSLAPYRVIHFATHALVDDRVSFRTALALAPGGGQDGFVTPGELAGLRLDADLVVLSACRTAGGVVVDGEGVQGLTAPLLAAGARSIVATGWRVGDERTVSLVERFYAELARGRTVADALRAAKLAAIERKAPASVWAAFTVFGDPFVTVPLRPAAS